MCSSQQADQWMLCPQCDLMTQLPQLTPGSKASCPRCDTTLVMKWDEPRKRPTGYALAALFMLLLANLFPFVNMHVAGMSSEITLMRIPQVWSRSITAAWRRFFYCSSRPFLRSV